MPAVTPNARNHRDLAEHASRFVKVDELPWESTRFPGVHAKTLLFDKERGLVTVLLKMEPGARLPDHEHVQIEQTYVLDGHLVDDEGETTAGNFVWRPAGSRHTAHTPEGGLMIAMFLVPNRFYDQPGPTLDMHGGDWESAWGGAAGAPRR
jgi:anti-sigma factor ChrR (cupin superfamily)